MKPVNSETKHDDSGGLPPRVRIWIDPETNCPAHERYEDQHDELGHVDHGYVSEVEMKQILARKIAEAKEDAADMLNEILLLPADTSAARLWELIGDTSGKLLEEAAQSRREEECGKGDE